MVQAAISAGSACSAAAFVMSLTSSSLAETVDHGNPRLASDHPAGAADAAQNSRPRPTAPLS